jgi:pyridoxamine 5'-phosphate oxidase
VEKTDHATSDKYFLGRPVGSQIGGIASPQSQVIENREVLENQVKQVEKMKLIKRPDHWGGFVVNADVIEFWQSRDDRLHDRIRYSLISTGNWRIERLAP